MGHSQKCYAFHARDRRFVETPPPRHTPPPASKLASSDMFRRAFPSQLKVKFTKGAGRMPWHQEPKKDVISCEKLRGGANIH